MATPPPYTPLGYQADPPAPLLKTIWCDEISGCSGSVAGFPASGTITLTNAAGNIMDVRTYPSDGDAWERLAREYLHGAGRFLVRRLPIAWKLQHTYSDTDSNTDSNTNKHTNSYKYGYNRINSNKYCEFNTNTNTNNNTGTTGYNGCCRVNQ